MNNTWHVQDNGGNDYFVYDSENDEKVIEPLGREDAHLIAAAPDLFEELEKANRVLLRVLQEQGIRTALEAEGVSLAHNMDTIAKAKGGQ